MFSLPQPYLYPSEKSLVVEQLIELVTPREHGSIFIVNGHAILGLTYSSQRKAIRQCELLANILVTRRMIHCSFVSFIVPSLGAISGVLNVRGQEINNSSEAIRLESGDIAHVRSPRIPLPAPLTLSIHIVVS